MTGATRAGAVWGLSRLVLVVLLFSVERGSGSDLRYYAATLADLESQGIGGTLVEYPVPAVLVLAAPYALLALLGATAGYPLALVLAAVALDGVLLRALLRRGRREGDAGPLGVPVAVWAWVVAVPALGAISYARFDLLPGVLVASALLSLAVAPRWSATYGVLATSAKYSPALVLPALAAPARTRRRVLVTGLAAGIAMAGLSIAVAGWDRTVSPLRYQGERGLQIESVAATPAMLRWAVDPAGHRVHFATSKAWEIEGPGVGALLTASAAVTALLAVVLVGLWVLAWVRLRDTAAAVPAVVWLALGAVAAFVVGGKVLSPQYLLWLLPAACAGLALVEDPRERRLLSWWTAGLLVAAGMTHAIYPHGYTSLLFHSGWSLPMAVLLAVRNLLLVVLCVVALFGAARQVTRAPRRPTDRAASPAA